MQRAQPTLPRSRSDSGGGLPGGAGPSPGRAAAAGALGTRPPSISSGEARFPAVMSDSGIPLRRGSGSTYGPSPAPYATTADAEPRGPPELGITESLAELLGQHNLQQSLGSAARGG